MFRPLSLINESGLEVIRLTRSSGNSEVNPRGAPQRARTYLGHGVREDTEFGDGPVTPEESAGGTVVPQTTRCPARKTNLPMGADAAAVPAWNFKPGRWPRVECDAGFE